MRPAWRGASGGPRPGGPGLASRAPTPAAAPDNNAFSNHCSASRHDNNDKEMTKEAAFLELQLIGKKIVTNVNFNCELARCSNYAKKCFSAGFDLKDCRENLPNACMYTRGTAGARDKLV